MSTHLQQDSLVLAEQLLLSFLAGLRFDLLALPPAVVYLYTPPAVIHLHATALAC